MSSSLNSSSNITNDNYHNSNNNNYSGNSSSSYATSSSAQQNKVIDQISLKCQIKKIGHTSEEENNHNYYYLESELRSTILQLSLLDVHLKKLPEGRKNLPFKVEMIYNSPVR